MLARIYEIFLSSSKRKYLDMVPLADVAMDSAIQA
jgi:hypothetical protein